MNILKTTIATAAVITCCLGNEMPAKAQMTDFERWQIYQGWIDRTNERTERRRQEAQRHIDSLRNRMRSCSGYFSGNNWSSTCY